MLDFNAQTMKNFSKLNHVGEVMLPDDKEKIERFFNWLEAEYYNRRKILSDYNGGYRGYIAAGNVMPWVTVMIHNYGAFAETYPAFDERIIMLTREALKCGISFIFTAITTNAIKLRVIQNFKTQITLRMNDDSYGFVFSGLRGKKPSNIKGRGLAMHDGVNEFQTAYIGNPDDINDKIAKLVEESACRYGSRRAHRIVVLPDIYKPSMAREYIQDSPEGTLPLALDSKSVEPVYYNHSRPVILTIAKNEVRPAFMQGTAENCLQKTIKTVCLYLMAQIPLKMTHQQDMNAMRTETNSFLRQEKPQKTRVFTLMFSFLPSATS